MWYYRPDTLGGFSVEWNIPDGESAVVDRRYATRDDAAARVNYLNGGLGIDQEQMVKLVALLTAAYSPRRTQ